jgi:hypothetical protein
MGGFQKQEVAPMDFSLILDQWLLGLGIVFLVSAITALALNKRQRDAVFHRLHFRHRRASGASTPPRSLSPTEKKGHSSVDSKEPDYTTVFPPSRRFVLPELAENTIVLNKKVILGPEPAEGFLLNDALPITQSYDLETAAPKYTPTGFSTAQIKAMGDFPAYDILSGVPLPEPYHNFDPARALPRPYRPFRWAYHQTMCKLSKLF